MKKRLVNDLLISVIVFAFFIGTLLLSNYIHYGTFIFK